MDEPPIIDLKAIGNGKDTVPVALFGGADDVLADPKDVTWAKDEIGDAIVHFEIIPNFNHSSFMMANDMSYMNRVLEVI